MRQYELMLILDPETDERNLQPTLEKMLAVVGKEGGSVDEIDLLGRRRLAYEIKKQSEGIYAVAYDDAAASAYSAASSSASAQAGTMFSAVPPRSESSLPSAGSVTA